MILGERKNQATKCALKSATDVTKRVMASDLLPTIFPSGIPFGGSITVSVK